MKKRLGLLFILLTLPLLVWAFDFGLIFDQSVGRGGYSGDSSADNTSSLIPRFSTLLGDRGEIFISAGIMAEYVNDSWSFVPELLRTELTWHFDFGDLRIGRMNYSDPLGFIAEGLFDGGRFSYDSNFGTFSLGGWYTGFLYNRRVNITMTDDELRAYNAVLDYDDFANSYFAPSRFLYALDWTHNGIGTGFIRPGFSFLGQFDLSDSELHSQYLTASLSLPLDAFLFNLGGSLAFIQDSGDSDMAYAAEARIAWVPPTAFGSRLSLLGRYSSGKSGNTAAFLPITTKFQGSILKAKLSSLSMISLDYTARLNRSFSINAASSYFIRNDLGTYNRYPVDSENNSGNLLGNEFSGRLYWSPYSDLAINVGAGIFMPSMGNVSTGEKNLWRVELGLVLSLY